MHTSASALRMPEADRRWYQGDYLIFGSSGLSRETCGRNSY